MPFQIVSVMLQVFTLGTFSAGSLKSGMRSWVMETTSLVPLFALSLLRSGKHHSSSSSAPTYVHRKPVELFCDVHMHKRSSTVV